MERNILLKIKYDGSRYCGWQRQLDDITVQGTIEKAIREMLKIKNVVVAGSSRTDAGVHALSYPVTFKLDVPIPTENIKRALNGRLPNDIRVLEVSEVPMEFHPRFKSKKKTYVYRILEGREKSPFAENYFYQVPKCLDIEKMKNAAKSIEGVHDFASFQAMGGTIRESTVREIYSLKIEEHKIMRSDKLIGESLIWGDENRIIDIAVTGNGFLYNMVRIIVGTLIDIGRGKIEEGKIEEIINSKNRENAGHTAPAAGLYLKEVNF